MNATMSAGRSTRASPESKTNFVGGAAAGSTLTGECTAFHRGRTTMVWQTLIRNDAGKLCAVVSQTQLVIEPK